jgi:hypothetical protein
VVQVLLLSKDWPARALLRAQLIEEGLEVEAYEAVGKLGTAPIHPHPKAQFPKLLLADLSASDSPATDLERLAAWAKWVPVWIIIGRNVVHPNELGGRGFEAVLFRPIGVHELVEQIKQRICS